MTYTAQAPTPRTDYHKVWAGGLAKDKNVVKAEFAEELERELAQARADIEERDRRIAAATKALDVRDKDYDLLRERCEGLEAALRKVVERRDMHGYTSTNKRLDDMQEIARAALARTGGEEK